MLDSLVRVSRRVAEDQYASILAQRRGPRSSLTALHPRLYHSPKGATFPRPLSRRLNRCWPDRRQMHHPEEWLITWGRVWSQALPFQQFHVLFNSIFKVLFIFRSLYLCAIGLPPIFSFRWNLPPILSCIPKQLDSSKALHMERDSQPSTGFSPSVTSCSKEHRLAP